MRAKHSSHEIRSERRPWATVARWLTGCVAALVLAPAGAARAEQHEVELLEWKNNGAYAAEVVIKHKNPKTGNVTTSNQCWPVGGHGVADDGGRFIYNGQTAFCDPVDDVEAGEEIWLEIKISAGDKVSCRKDENKLIYDGKARKTATFSSGGTTTLDNRCKWRGVEDA